MTQTSTLQRMRTGDIRSVPVATWPLLALAIAGVIVQVQRAGSSLDVASLPSMIAFVGPLCFAAAVASVAPADRRLPLGAMAIAFPVALRVLQAVFQVLYMPQLADAAGSLGPLYWVATLVGTLLIARAIGGVRSQLGWLIVLGGVVAVLANYLVFLGRMPELFPPDLGVDVGPTIALSFLGPTLFIGWAYLMGAAIDRRMRLIAFGSAVILTMFVLEILVALMFPATPQQPTDFRLRNLAFGTAHLIGWLALIAGALTELRQQPVTTDPPA